MRTAACRQWLYRFGLGILVCFVLTGCGGDSGEQSDEATARLSLRITRTPSSSQSVSLRQALSAPAVSLQAEPGDPGFITRLTVSISAADIPSPITTTVTLGNTEQDEITVELVVPQGNNRRIAVTASNADDIPIFVGETTVDLQQGVQQVELSLERGTFIPIPVTPDALSGQVFVLEENRGFVIAPGLGAIAIVFGVFEESTTTFVLTAGGKQASGEITLDSCTFTVDASTFAANEGPQEGDIFTFDPCNVDAVDGRLLLEPDPDTQIISEPPQPNTTVFVSVTNATLLEGDAGTTEAVFTVSLIVPSLNEIRVDFTTEDDTAVAGMDYQTTAGRLIFTPGTRLMTIPVTVFGDRIHEPDESFRLLLRNARNATLLVAERLGTIMNDDPLPSLSLANVSVDEGDTDTTPFTFTVASSQPSARDITVDYVTVDGTATAGTDYTAASGTVTIPAGQTTATLTVLVGGDRLVEANETFTVALRNVEGATLADRRAVGTIVNDDGATLSLADLALPEGDGDPTSFTFMVTSSQPSARDITVDYVTVDGTATAGTDYTAASGTITIPAGQTTATLTVLVRGDLLVEANETFTVVLRNVEGATLADATAVGTIVNDDRATVSLADVSLEEGNSGPTPFLFTVTSSHLSAAAITVDYATSDGTATAGTDYTAASGTVTIPAGETTATFTLLVGGDLVVEANETFTVVLRNAVGATLADRRAVGRILNDDGTTLSLADLALPEGDTGSTPFTFTVTSSQPSTRDITVDFATADGTATADGGDYTAASGTVTIPAGETTATFTVLVGGDLVVEANETFTVVLRNAVGATLADRRAVGRILNDDGTTLSLADLALPEGDTGSTPFTFTVTSSQPSTRDITVDFATADGTATADGGDYTAASGTVTIPAGETTATFTLLVGGDLVVEANETFTVVLRNAVGATLADRRAVGRILNDDGTTLSLADLALPEGDTGSTPFTFTVTSSQPSTRDITVDFATADGTATADGGDYTAASGTVTIPAGETTATFTVLVGGDLVVEANETFTVVLRNAVGATLADRRAVGRILNDDGTTLSLADLALPEGDTGSTPFTFTVTSSQPSTRDITVDYATSDGTATADGGDYTAASGTVTIPAGETTATFTVLVGGDLVVEANETFTVVLRNAVGATLADRRAVGRILNDDEATLSLADLALPEGDTGSTPFTFTVTSSQPSTRDITVDFATADGTATAGTDYTAASGTVTIPAGETTATFTVLVGGDLVVEANETFTVVLRNAVGATLVDRRAVGRILNDDGTTLSLADLALPEGDTGSTPFTFTVTSSQPSTRDITVDFATADGTATADGGDYTAASGTVTIPAGETTATFTVLVGGDLVVEANETFTVVLRNAVGATLVDRRAVGRILNDDGTTLSLADLALPEGDTGSTPFTFTVTSSQPSTRDITVDFATADGTATAGTDYTAASGTVTIPAGETTATFTVLVGGDLVVEANETFTVVLRNAVGATLADRRAVGRILNDDEATLSLADLALPEGDTGSTPFTFTVTSSQPSTRDITVDFATADGTATAGTDYTAASGTVTIPAGETTATFTVLVGGDLVVEANETFTVVLRNAVGATLADRRAVGRILNDDGTTLSLADLALPEGDTGSTPFTFTVTSSQPSTRDITVDFATADGTATADGGDYTAASGTVTIPAGETTATFTVLVGGDLVVEANETFTVVLRNAVGATLADRRAVGSILNDDEATLSLADLALPEGDTGSTPFTFTVTSSQPSTRDITVDFATADGTATAGTDYTAASGTVTIPAGQTTATFTLLVGGDLVVEANETFTVVLRNAVGATLVDRRAVGRILNDDGTTLSLADLALLEGNGGLTPFTFTVTSSQPSTRDITVDFATADGTATADGGDYTAASGTVTIPAGETTATFTVLVGGDLVVEANETFTVVLRNAVGATLADRRAVGRILNDDGTTLSLADLALPEGDTGSTPFTFTVTSSQPSARDITVDYATSDGTATADGGDYTAASGTVTIPAGETTATFTVLVGGDLVVEANETFTVVLRNAVGATLADRRAVGRILNDDGTTLSLADLALPEGDTGSTPFTFTVTSSQPSTRDITVDFATADGTATAGTDYTAASGTVTIPAGETTATFTVLVGGDLVVEANETFTVVLRNAVGATLADRRAVGTILNDDNTTVSLADVSMNEGDTDPTPFSFTLTSSHLSASDITVDFATTDGTATAGTDYTAASGTVTIPAGQTTATFTVLVGGDLVVEANETFTVTLRNAVGATLADRRAVGTILNDDNATVSLADVSMNEGDTDPTPFPFTLTSSHLSASDITVDFATTDGTATAGTDYTAASGTVTIPAGQTTATLTVLVADDLLVEANETFTVTLRNAVGATLGEATAVGTIVNDDGATLSIVDLALPEGDTDPAPFTFTITSSNPSTVDISVDFATADGTATAGTDYTAASGTAIIAAGQTTTSLTVIVLGDTRHEGRETFTVNLTNAANATISDSQAIGTIRNDDPEPVVSIDSLLISEGNEPTGAANATFLVTLDVISDLEVMVDFATQDSTAVAGNDYLDTTGTLVFDPGATQLQILVPLLGNQFVEQNRDFFVNLTGVVNATLGLRRGIGTIFDDDPLYPGPVFAVGAAPLENPQDIIVADLNGDPFLDVITANSTEVAVLLGAPNGTLTTPLYFAPGTTPRGLAVADFDGDTHLDLVVANQFFANFLLLLGNGNGTFQSPTAFSVVEEATAIAVADMNGDGSLDVVVTDAGVSAVLVFLGNGNGSFTLPPGEFPTGPNPQAVAIGDLNEDGIPDVVTANPDSSGASSIVVLLGNSNGSLQSPQSFPAGANPIAVTIADVAGNGFRDVVTTDTGALLVFLGDGTGALQAPALSFPVAGDPVDVMVSDIDGDSVPDLVASTKITNTVTVLSGPTFRTPQAFLVGASPESLAVADLNGDTLMDAVTANVDSNDVTLLLGAGANGFVTRQDRMVNTDPTSVAVGDVDGDANIDVVIGNETTNAVEVFLGNGDGTVQAPVPLSLASDGPPNSVAVGVLTPSGFADIVAANASQNTVHIFLSNGDGTFQPQTTLTIAMPQAVALSDLDGDGDLDLVTADGIEIPLGAGTATSVTSALNNGDGTFQEPGSLSFLSRRGTALAVGDLSGDTAPDLVVIAAADDAALVILGNGDGTFQVPALSLATSNRPVDVALADLNGDDQLDVIIVHDSPPIVSTFLGNGDGTFQTRQDFTVGRAPVAVAVEQVNADGRFDLVVVDSDPTTSPVRVLFGNGNGTVARLPQTFAGNQGALDVALADFNGDGRPDIVTINRQVEGSGSLSDFLSILLHQ